MAEVVEELLSLRAELELLTPGGKKEKGGHILTIGATLRPPARRSGLAEAAAQSETRALAEEASCPRSHAPIATAAGRGILIAEALTSFGREATHIMFSLRYCVILAESSFSAGGLKALRFEFQTCMYVICCAMTDVTS